MAERMAGIHVQGSSLPETVALIRRADQASTQARPARRRPLRAHRPSTAERFHNGQERAQ